MSEKMIFDYEFGRVKVGFVDDEGNETGWVWKKADFEKVFKISLPACKHITFDEHSNIFAIFGADGTVDENVVRNTISNLRNTIKTKVNEMQTAQRISVQEIASATENRLLDIEQAIAFLLRGGQQ